MVYRSNIQRVVARMQGEPDRARQFVHERLRKMIVWFDGKLHERVPVWSGRAARNMIWSQGSPNATEFEPDGTGEYGESRRAANQALAQATLTGLTFTGAIGTYYLANHARNIGLIEDGAAPTPERSRTPEGIFRITIADLMLALDKGVIR